MYKSCTQLHNLLKFTVTAEQFLVNVQLLDILVYTIMHGLNCVRCPVEIKFTSLRLRAVTVLSRALGGGRGRGGGAWGEPPPPPPPKILPPKFSLDREDITIKSMST